jgi:hypothetical protein
MAYDVGEEVRLLLEHLHRIAGDKSHTTFGEVFEDEEVTQTFESLVGTLKAAKKRNHVDFKGHLLMYPLHKDTVITIKEDEKDSSSLPLPANVTTLPATTPLPKKTEVFSKSNVVSPRVNSSSEDGIPAHIVEKRKEFEAERLKFENKIKDTWTESEISAYYEAKLEAEMQFFRDYSETYRSDSTPSISTPRTVSSTSITPTVHSTVNVVKEEPKPEPVNKKPVSQPKASKPFHKSQPSTGTTTTTDSNNQDIVKVVKGIMNQVFHKMKAGFETSGQYGNEYILSVVKETIVNSTMELPEDPSTPTLKKIMNNVFASLKGKFPPGEYTGQQILNVLKDTIVSTTNDLMKQSSETQPQPEQSQTQTPADQPQSTQSQPQSTQSQPKFQPQKTPVTKTTTANSSFQRANVQETKQTPIHNEPPKKVSAPLAVSEPAPKPAPVQSEPKKVQSPVNTAASEPAPAKPVSKAKPVVEEENVSKGVELMRNEAQARINQNPKAKEADITDPEILSTYIRMRDDQDPLSWMILGYDNSVSPDKLVVIESGDGDFSEFVSHLSDEKPVYMYLNYKFGDTGRPRFIFMSFVPEAFNGLQKARVLGHRAAIETFIKYYQISWHCLTIDEIKEDELKNKLRKAGGADYSVQESNKGNFSSYKKTTREFYEETDKRTAIKGLVYEKGPLAVTPCDITGRSMVAPSTEFLKNTSEVFKGTGKGN